jgi:hypothetical protein
MSGGRGVWLRLCAAACLVVFGCVCAAAAVRPAEAAARSTYTEGSGGRTFSFVSPLSSSLSLVSGATGQNVGMKVGDLLSYGADSPAYVGLGIAHPDPRSVQAIAGGGVLVADAANRVVLRMDESGALVWKYTAADDPALQAPVCARRLADRGTLVVDRDACRVFIVDVNGVLRWQYGTTGVSGSGVNRLDAPQYAEQLADGDIAICDAGNHRVIVVQSSDYTAGTADLGYSAASIVWQYGTTGVSGSGTDELVRPTSAQWLTTGADAGNVLICDEGAARVIEVADAGVVWRYPESDSADVRPSLALGAAGGDGIVWVADAAGGDIIGVATGSAAGSPTGHDVVARYGAGRPAFAGSLSAPCAVSLTDAGGLAVADPGAGRVTVLGTTSDSAVATSRPLTCGRAGRKLFVSITCSYLTVPYAGIGVSVRVDGGPWVPLMGQLGGAADGTGAAASGTLPLKGLSVGKEIEYMLSMKNSYLAFAPRLLSLAIAYEPRAGGSGSGGGGDSGDSAHCSGSGAYTYPGSGGGSGQGSGGGVGGGTGSGSGAGSGSGYGSGSSASTMGVNNGSSAGSATGAETPDSVDSTSTAPGSDATVSGYLMKASGYAGGGEGGGSSPAAVPTTRAWLVVPGGLSVLGALVLGTAVLAERRRLKAYADYDASRPRPFPAQSGTPAARPLPPPPLIRAGGAR